MSTRNRCLPAVLILLAVVSLAQFSGPDTIACAGPLPVIDCGDPDGFPERGSSGGGTVVNPAQGALGRTTQTIQPGPVVPSSTERPSTDLNFWKLCRLLFLHVLARR